ncbi:MAG: mannitol dehydrogenase family protein [Litoreibacter sp.]|nr:mannitol dehydrogenase family protein [Litoreibacter sp.]
MSLFDPSKCGTGIVHIGPGAFHRAHQAVYTEDAMAQDGGDWRIIGVSPRSTSVADALEAQSGRYTLVTRGAEGTRYRVIQSIAGALALTHGVQPVFDHLIAPQTKIVSLTVTEKAYRSDAPMIALLLDALDHRRAAGLAPFTLLSCDNLPDNGAFLRKLVLDAATIRNAALADWIEEYCRFPSTMVDRITPAATPALEAEVAEQTGWADRMPVETEDFSQWVIEDDFVDGRPAWEVAGAELVKDVRPYEKMKLRMLNGAHSMLAYAGHLADLRYVRDVMSEPVLAAIVHDAT